MGYLKPRFRAILNEAILDNVSERMLTEKGEDILRHGVFLKDKNLFYWLDRRNRDCYIVLAPNLTFSDQYNCWIKKWHDVPNGSRSPLMRVEERQLVSKVRWLEVKGSFSTVNLNLYTTYMVVFLVKPTDGDPSDYNFPKDGIPVELSLVLPSASRQEITHETIKTKKNSNQNDWSSELPAGKFYHTSSTMGTMYFSMKNTDATWKEGISVFGVCVKPYYGEPVTKNILNWVELIKD